MKIINKVAGGPAMLREQLDSARDFLERSRKAPAVGDRIANLGWALGCLGYIWDQVARGDAVGSEVDSALRALKGGQVVAECTEAELDFLSSKLLDEGYCVLMGVKEKGYYIGTR